MSCEGASLEKCVACRRDAAPRREDVNRGGGGAPARAAQSGAHQRRGAATDDLYAIPPQAPHALSACCGTARRRSPRTDGRGVERPVGQFARCAWWVRCVRTRPSERSRRGAMACSAERVRVSELPADGGVEPQRRGVRLVGGALRAVSICRVWADTQRVWGGDGVWEGGGGGGSWPAILSVSVDDG